MGRRPLSRCALVASLCAARAGLASAERAARTFQAEADPVTSSWSWTMTEAISKADLWTKAMAKLEDDLRGQGRQLLGAGREQGQRLREQGRRLLADGRVRSALQNVAVLGAWELVVHQAPKIVAREPRSDSGHAPKRHAGDSSAPPISLEALQAWPKHAKDWQVCWGRCWWLGPLWLWTLTVVSFLVGMCLGLAAPNGRARDAGALSVDSLSVLADKASSSVDRTKLQHFDTELKKAASAMKEAKAKADLLEAENASLKDAAARVRFSVPESPTSSVGRLGASGG